jgi:hypothetical protein
LPSADFVKQLCDTTQATVALSLFRKGTPWTRAYVRPMQVEAWYASGGRSEPAKLTFAEELLVLARRDGATGGVQVSGSGSYDVLRWDGTCVSVMSDEITTRRPGNPDVAPIQWKRLDPDVQTALEKDKKIAFRLEGRRQACAEIGAGADKKCAKAEQGLARIIGDFVRAGGEFPVRAKLP